ncbi:MAG: DNA primase [Deltaproteobacteria bacterium]|nr:MAG: DNA primase [Deltaproteobacteria bacterium]
MSYANYDDVLRQLTDHGLIVSGLEVGSDRVRRCLTRDDQREKRGWYWLSSITIGSDPYIVGAYGIYTGSDNGKQKVVLSRQQSERLSDDQRKAIAAQQQAARKKAEAERIRQHDRAAARAKDAWGKLAATGSSSYLTAKQVGAHGVRFGERGEVVIPMRDGADAIRGLQVILPPGHERIAKIGRNKEFFPAGLGMSGTWHLIGDHPRDLLLVTEGYATGATLHEATGHPVAVVWSANNLLSGCKALRKRYPRCQILICADDDAVQSCVACDQFTAVATADCSHCGKPHRKQNAGVSCAEAAALAVGGAWLVPQFRAERPKDCKGDTDFNDLHVAEGLRIVGAQIAGKVADLGWCRPALEAAQVTPCGEGGKRPALKSMLTMDEALDRFCMVYGGKGTMFDRQEHCLVPKADVLDILPEHGWRDMRAHKTVVRLDEVGFDPAGTDKRIVCNLYGGWPTEPVAGDCSNLLATLRHLCSNEVESDEVFEWVLKWLAFPIQHPGSKMQTALVFHGPQGTGKNLFFESIMAIYGEYGRIVDQAAIEDKFNDWASRKLFLIADEVVARTELFHVKNKLKSFVTGEWIRINPKNVAAHDERNHVNLVFLSNESTPLVLEHDDRRYMVIHTPDKLPAEFYSAVRAELDNGGVAALHHYLKTIDLSGFDIYTKPLRTKAKLQLIEASLDSVSSFLREWYLGEIQKLPFCPCTIANLFSAYQKYCAATCEKAPRNRKQFTAELRMQSGWRVGPFPVRVSPGLEDRTTRKMVIPADDLLAGGEFARQDGISQEQWLAECHRAFSVAGEFAE